jgi:hypothetical protein
MHARAFERRAHHILERSENIIRGQHCIFRRLPNAVRAVAQHIGQRTHEHAHLAVKGTHATERLCARRNRIDVFDEPKALLVMHQ